MITVSINVRGDIAKIIDGKRWGALPPSDREDANMRAATELHKWVMRNFEDEGAGLAEGAWQPLNKYYLAWKVKHGWSEKILHKTGNLRASFSPFSDADTAGVGAQASFGVDYAKVHQEGIGHMPRRRMLPILSDIQDAVVPIYKRAIQDYFERG